MTTYLVRGFHRQDHKMNVCMLVNVNDHGPETDSPHAIAELAAPQFCFHAAANVDVPVPDDYTFHLFMSDAELYDAVPELKPPQRRRQRRR